MKLIVISPSKKEDAEVPFLINMFEQGLPTYHIRKTKFSTRELKDLLLQIPEKYHRRIVIHSHHDLAMRFNLKGIYNSRSHKKRKYRTWLRIKWFKLIKRNLQISSTYRSIEGLLDYDSKYDYVFLAPVFDSISGNFQAGYSEKNFHNTLKHTQYKVIARGGVSTDTLQKAHELGFAGVAFYSSIWKKNNPVQEFMKVKEKFVELKIPIE